MKGFARATWIVGALLIGALLVFARPGYSRPMQSSGRATVVAATGVVYHGVNQTLLQRCLTTGQNCLVKVPGLVHCMRVYKICNQAAAANSVLSRPLVAGTPLLSKLQVLRSLGALNAGVKRATAVLMTYGSIHAKEPALAASTTVNRGRPMYLVTEWFAKPVLVNFSAPEGAPASGYVTQAQYVVDAATGRVTDWTP